MLKIDYSINENKINNWLDELDQDRKKLFDDIKVSKSTEKVKEEKIKSLEHIQRCLLTYKKILNKEKNEKEKY
jgi:hypothetical protein